MASRKYTLFFYVALLVAMGATYGVYRVIQTTKASNRIATGPVVVAARDVHEGELIDQVALNVVQWPVTTIPAGAYQRIDSVAGRVARVDVFRGEPFVPGRLAPEGVGAGLEVKIAPGRRAYSVRVNDLSSIAGLVHPNSRVDILLTMNPTVGMAQRKAKIFMENVRILAMGSQTQRGDDGRPIQTSVATLDVVPAQAESLAVAQAQGSIQLVLRGYGDPDSVDTKGATTSDVVRALRDVPVSTPVRRSIRPAVPTHTTLPDADPKPKVDPAPEPPTRTLPPIVQKPETVHVEVYRGGKKEDVRIKKDSVRKDTTGVRPDTGSVFWF